MPGNTKEKERGKNSVSVLEEDRRKNKLKVFTEALDLVMYTLKITKNPNVFTAEYQKQVTDDIIETAKNIYIDAWDANNIKVVTKDDWKERRSLQLRAARECNRLLALIGIAKSAFHLRNKRVKFWVGKVLNVRKLIRNWNTSDSKRYSELTE